MAQSKRTPTNRRRSNPPAGSAGKWIVVLLLVVIVLLGYVASHLWKKDAHLGSGSGRQDVRSVKKPDEKPPVKPDFEFYTLLPQQNNGPVVATPDKQLPPDKPAPESKTTETPASKGPERNYWIQAGSFATQPEAERRKAEIAMQGFASEVRLASVNGKTYYRIQIGPIKQEQLATLRKRLADAHIDTLPPRPAE
ncbi:MAG: SPOR domain-containing protein [Halothiobacillus sp.]|nr:SPOR domain-containing protein [Halothiobacillus sp.]